MNDKSGAPIIKWSLLSYIPGLWYNGKVGLIIAVSPPTEFQNNILLVLFMQTIPYDGLTEGCGWCEGPYHNDNFFLSGVAQRSVISMWYTHREGTLKGEAAATAFYSFHLACKQSCTVLRGVCSNFLLQKDARLQISFLRLPSPSPILWHSLRRNFFQSHVW